MEKQHRKFRGGSATKFHWDEASEGNSMSRLTVPRGRQTVHWPFQSVVTEDSIPATVREAAVATTSTTPKPVSRHGMVSVRRPEEAHLPFRPRTWQPRTAAETADGDDQTVRRSTLLIPDYVINYLRGETPETLAQRKAAREQQAWQKLQQYADAEAAEEAAERERERERDQERAELTSSLGSSTLSPGSEDQMVGGKRRRRHYQKRSWFGWLNRNRRHHPNDGQQTKLANHRRSRSFGSGRGGSSDAWWTAVHGWRGGVLCNALLATVVFAAAVTCLGVAVSRREKRKIIEDTIVYRGSCETTRRNGWLLQAMLAILATAAMAAAQYVFQVLSSPTRAAVDAAHSQGHWLDVGVPSLRNVWWGLRGGGSGSGSGSGSGGGSQRGQERVRAGAALLVLAAGMASAVLYNGLLSVHRDNDKCQLVLHTPLLAAAVGVAGVTAVCFLAMAVFCRPSRARHHHFRHVPLVTFGDAIASFLRDPDPTTRGVCLLTKDDVCHGRRWRPHDPDAKLQTMFFHPQQQQQQQQQRHQSSRWVSAPSRQRWIVGILVWVVLVGLAAAGLALALTKSSSSGNLGDFGILSKLFRYKASSPSIASLLASIPQLGVAVLYFVLDAHLSVYFLAHESARSAGPTPRSLRVSHHPRGFQTTSLYLTLPRAWSWLLLFLFAGLSFLLRQGILDTTSNNNSNSNTTNQLGLSAPGLVGVLAILVLLALLAVLLGCRRSTDDASNPLFLIGGSCSAVLSARCHPALDETAERTTLGGSVSISGGSNNSRNSRNSGSLNNNILPLWLRPLTWGVVAADQIPMDDHPHLPGMGHCTYSSRPVGSLIEGQGYA